MSEKTIAGKDIGIHAFLSMEAQLGICIFHDYGASFLSWEDFLAESEIDMSPSIRNQYATAFVCAAKRFGYSGGS